MQQKQQAILDFIHNYPHQYPPTIQEIGEGVGLRNSISVCYYLTELEKRGYTKLRAYSPRCVVLTDGRL